MRSAETSHKSKPSSHSGKPFFNKSEESRFGVDSEKGADQSGFFDHNGIQPKLTIGKPNDVYEQEAEQMASHVVQRLVSSPAATENQSAPAISHKSAPQRSTINKAEDEDTDEEELFVSTR